MTGETGKREYDLANAIASLAHYSSATGTLWGIFAAATFTAAGFGIAMEDRFTSQIAIFLTIGFVAFAIGHGYFIRHHVNVQRTISTEILDYLKEAKPSPTAFPKSIHAICAPENKIGASIATHVIIDLCVLAIIWQTARN